MLTLQQIIDESDVRVPNTFTTAQKTSWLNEINVEFFEIVRIPKVHTFSTVAAQTDYPVAATIHSHAIETVRVNTTFFDSMQFENVQPGRNYWILDDDTNTLKLNPAPSGNAAGIVTYHKKSETVFLSTALTANPDAPKEFHWVYILGLCERMAKAMNDVTLANNYANDYRAQLAVAQEQYRNRSVTGVGE